MTAASTTEIAPDYDDIVRVVHLYTDGFGSHDVGMFEEAFHPDATIFFTNRSGEVYQNRWANLFQESADEDVKVTCRVISVTQAGDIANVLLGFHGSDGAPDDYWVDFHNLLKINGVWKIINKTATHSSRAGGA